MSNLVQLTKEGDVAIITVNNPPVNAMGPGVPEGISECIAQVEKDESVRAAVLIGGGEGFTAGADIREFGKMVSGEIDPGDGFLPLMLQIENCTKPVVAAIHGNALGGGLEAAMACHYRVAVPGAKVGQPEVNLGLIPGAAGTQRLPRLSGVAKAIEICCEGKPIKAAEAQQAGILDRLIEGSLLEGAIAFAGEVAGRPVVKTRNRIEKLGTAEENAPIFAAAREAGRKKFRGLLAPFAAIDAIEAATKLSFLEGCKEEQRFFGECLHSEQSKALIHIFFAEREVSKIPDIPKETPILPVKTAAVIGVGTMGGGIAMVFANAGFPVVVKESDQAALNRGMTAIEKNYASSVKRGRFSQQYVDERLRLIKPTLDYADLADADIVVEAVFENLEVKKKVFAELDRVAKPGAILASNTSTFSIDELASCTSRPQYVLGMHYFVPANVMRLLEVVRGRATSKTVIATGMQVAKRLGKIAVLVGNCEGFVANRMFAPYLREAQFLAEEGALPEAIDGAVTGFGLAMGPMAFGDLAGIEIGYHIHQAHKDSVPPGIRQPFAEDRMYEIGRKGQKTGAGWYKYDADRKPAPDPEAVSLVRRWAAEKGIAQRQISPEEILDRCIYALVNEGARILEEGYALRAGDIDIIYVNGFAFPAYRGGPMWYADRVGLKKVYERICEFHRQHGRLWEPAPLLKRLAEEGGTFAEFRQLKDAAAS